MLVSYPDFADAVCACLQVGKNCKIGKSDMLSAFRNLGISPRNWKWLVLKAKSPFDNKWYFFVDKCLPFGAAISCSHFQRLSNAISHLVGARVQFYPINYLDDFLFVGISTEECDGQMQVFLTICNKIRFPVSLEKMYWSCTLLTFLGFLLNSCEQTVSVPADKISKALNLISEFLQSKKVTVKMLQHLTVN